MAQPLKSINLCHWSIILGGRVKTPSEVRNYPEGTPKFTQLDYSWQRVNTVPLGVYPTAPPAVSTAQSVIT